MAKIIINGIDICKPPVPDLPPPPVPFDPVIPPDEPLGPPEVPEDPEEQVIISDICSGTKDGDLNCYKMLTFDSSVCVDSDLKTIFRSDSRASSESLCPDTYLGYESCGCNQISTTVGGCCYSKIFAWPVYPCLTNLIGNTIGSYIILINLKVDSFRELLKQNVGADGKTVFVADDGISYYAYYSEDLTHLSPLLAYTWAHTPDIINWVQPDFSLSDKSDKGLLPFPWVDSNVRLKLPWLDECPYFKLTSCIDSQTILYSDQFYLSAYDGQVVRLDDGNCYEVESETFTGELYSDVIVTDDYANCTSCLPSLVPCTDCIGTGQGSLTISGTAGSGGLCEVDGDVDFSLFTPGVPCLWEYQNPPAGLIIIYIGYDSNTGVWNASIVNSGITCYSSSNVSGISCVDGKLVGSFTLPGVNNPPAACLGANDATVTL